MNNYFDKNSTLLDITEKYPETVPVFVSNGFNNMDDAEQRAKFGRSVTLGMSLMLKTD